ncbi:MAG: hypothetical protein JXM79_16175 [Sedimentisphaerales bacterium]|nr:hypothetical protein [Sedimentisphaerales bacterium]
MKNYMMIYAREGDETKLRTRQWKFGDCDASDIRFTRSKDERILYAIVLGYPKQGDLKIRTLGKQTVIADGGLRNVTLLGHNGPLLWKRDAIALEVELPGSINPTQPAYAMKIEPTGKLRTD